LVTGSASRSGENPAREASYHMDVDKATSDLLIALGYVLDMQEEPCPYHSWRVAALATSMAVQTARDDASDVFYAAILHDVGAMGTFTHMMRYPTINSQKSKSEVVAHPERSRKIIANIPGLKSASKLAGEHHEFWNGYGYPSSERGESISIGAQFIRIADTMDLSKKLRPGCKAEDAADLAGLLCNIEIGPETVGAFKEIIFKEDLYSRLLDDSLLHSLVREIASQVPLPEEWSESAAFDAAMLVFAKTVDAKHCFTAGHSERVATRARNLVESMGLSAEDVRNAWHAGLVHDVGKVGVRRSIIDKVGPLDSNDFAMVRKYPILSAYILNDIAHLPELATIARHHHERWDGAGYPDGLRGEEIPLLSRVLAVADALDAITSTRSYKTAKSMPEAIRIVNTARGIQFDPQVVDAANSACARL